MGEAADSLPQATCDCYPATSAYGRITCCSKATAEEHSARFFC